MAKAGNSRKFGRSKDRPSNKTYVATNRRAKNKARNIAKDKALKVKAKVKKELRTLASRGRNPMSVTGTVAFA